MLCSCHFAMFYFVSPDVSCLLCAWCLLMLLFFIDVAVLFRSPLIFCLWRFYHAPTLACYAITFATLCLLRAPAFCLPCHLLCWFFALFADITLRYRYLFRLPLYWCWLMLIFHVALRDAAQRAIERCRVSLLMLIFFIDAIYRFHAYALLFIIFPRCAMMSYADIITLYRALAVYSTFADAHYSLRLLLISLLSLWRGCWFSRHAAAACWAMSRLLLLCAFDFIFFSCFSLRRFWFFRRAVLILMSDIIYFYLLRYYYYLCFRCRHAACCSSPLTPFAAWSSCFFIHAHFLRLRFTPRPCSLITVHYDVFRWFRWCLRRRAVLLFASLTYRWWCSYAWFYFFFIADFADVWLPCAYYCCSRWCAIAMIFYLFQLCFAFSMPSRDDFDVCFFSCCIIADIACHYDAIFYRSDVSLAMLTLLMMLCRYRRCRAMLMPLFVYFSLCLFRRQIVIRWYYYFILMPTRWRFDVKMPTATHTRSFTSAIIFLFIYADILLLMLSRCRLPYACRYVLCSMRLFMPAVERVTPRAEARLLFFSMILLISIRDVASPCWCCLRHYYCWYFPERTTPLSPPAMLALMLFPWWLYRDVIILSILFHCAIFRYGFDITWCFYCVFHAFFFSRYHVYAIILMLFHIVAFMLEPSIMPFFIRLRLCYDTMPAPYFPSAIISSLPFACLSLRFHIMLFRCLCLLLFMLLMLMMLMLLFADVFARAMLILICSFFFPPYVYCLLMRIYLCAVVSRLLLLHICYFDIALPYFKMFDILAICFFICCFILMLISRHVMFCCFSAYVAVSLIVFDVSMIMSPFSSSFVLLIFRLFSRALISLSLPYHCHYLLLIFRLFFSFTYCWFAAIYIALRRYA